MSTTAPIAVYVQARMSSARFPGKVLAPFRGTPVVSHVIACAKEALPEAPVVVVTSTAASDDPLVAYLKSLNVDVFRGPLENVFERFRLCTAHQRAVWILRLNADSPLLRPQVLRAVTAADRNGVDLVTTISPRTWPRGQNAELIRSSVLLSVPDGAVSAEDAEHVTAYFYKHASSYRILNVASPDSRLANLHLAVDSIDDLRRLETVNVGELDAVLAGRATAGNGSLVKTCSA